MIRAAKQADSDALLALRSRLWPDAPPEEHAQDLQRFFSGEAREPLEIFVREEPGGQLIGFCEASIRMEAHKALGFEHVGLIRCFRKDL